MGGDITTTSSPVLLLSSSGNTLWLLLPHVALALVILLLLFVDFLLYRRRTRFLQKRVMDKQELMQTFPKRVIAGLYRNVPSVAASPLHTPNHLASRSPTSVQKNIAITDIPALLSSDYNVIINTTSITTAPTNITTTTATGTPTTTATTITTNTTTSQDSESSSPQEARREKVHKKKHKLSEHHKSSKNASKMVSSGDCAEAADEERNKKSRGVPVSRRRLEKRESCRKLPPITDFNLSNGSVHAQKILLPLVDESERDVSMA